LGSHVEVETFYRTCKSGDVYLLCSDGLSDLVEDQEILELVESAHGDLSRANELLVNRANHYGGVDNITCLLVSTGDRS